MHLMKVIKKVVGTTVRHSMTIWTRCAVRFMPRCLALPTMSTLKECFVYERLSLSAWTSNDSSQHNTKSSTRKAPHYQHPAIGNEKNSSAKGPSDQTGCLPPHSEWNEMKWKLSMGKFPYGILSMSLHAHSLSHTTSMMPRLMEPTQTVSKFCNFIKYSEWKFKKKRK